MYKYNKIYINEHIPNIYININTYIHIHLIK